MTTRCKDAPSKAITSTNRSWVIGRGDSTPSSAKWMADASEVPIMIGKIRLRPACSRRMSTGVLSGTSTRTPTSSMAISTDLMVSATVEVVPQHRRDECISEPTSEFGHLRQRVECQLSRLRVALAQERHDALLEQVGFSLGGLPPRPQVSGVDAAFHELRRHVGELDGVGVVRDLVPRCATGNDAELLEPSELFEAHACRCAQFETV